MSSQARRLQRQQGRTPSSKYRKPGALQEAALRAAPTAQELVRLKAATQRWEEIRRRVVSLPVEQLRLWEETMDKEAAELERLASQEPAVVLALMERTLAKAEALAASLASLPRS